MTTANGVLLGSGLLVLSVGVWNLFHKSINDSISRIGIGRIAIGLFAIVSALMQAPNFLAVIALVACIGFLRIETMKDRRRHR